MFLTLEGIEGSGKSLQIRRIEAYLKDKGMHCLATREPGGTEFGRALRRVLLHKGSASREPLSELLLYLADRYQHLKEVILPALEQGRSFWIWSLNSGWPALETETNCRGLPSRKVGSRRRNFHFTKPCVKRISVLRDAGPSGFGSYKLVGPPTKYSRE